MSIHLGPLTLEGPAILASGLRGNTPQSLEEVYKSGAGATVTKSLTVNPREGNPEPNFVPVDGGGYVNAIGLNNGGAHQFARALGRPSFPVIVSMAGSSPDDFAEMIPLFDGVAGFELNLSCPHAEHLGREVGDNPKLVQDIVSTAKKVAHTTPVFAKVGPSMMPGVDVAIKAGIDGITAINTVPALALDDAGRPLLSHGTGGLSGKPIKPIALRTIHDIRVRHGNTIPIMGCGGICNAKDVFQFLQVGATAVQIGTAAMHNLSVFQEINEAWTAPQALQA